MQHSPPRRGGVDATSIKMVRSFLSLERTGWSDRRNVLGDGALSRLRFRIDAEPTTLKASRYRARASRPSARNKVASRLLIDRAASPPLRGGKYFSHNELS